MRVSGLSELLEEAGLSSAYDQAVDRKDWDAFRRVFRQLQWTDEQTEEHWNWVWHSPHSCHNTDPIRLAPEVIRDSRITTLRDRDQRIVQYLFEEYGGLGAEGCLWDGCGRPALRGLAFCPHCAVVHAHISTRLTV